MPAVSKRRKTAKLAAAKSLAKRTELKVNCQKKVSSSKGESSSQTNDATFSNIKKMKAVKSSTDPHASLAGLKLVQKRIKKNNERKKKVSKIMEKIRRDKYKKRIKFDEETECEEEVKDNESEREKLIPEVQKESNVEVIQLKGISNFTDITAPSAFKYSSYTKSTEASLNSRSKYKTRKRLQDQLDTILPEYEIVKKRKFSIEEDVKLVKNNKFSRSQINELSKSGKTPSYPTIKKAVDKIIPDVPQYHIPDSEKRKNVLFLSFYELLVARLKNMKKIPSRRLRITIGGDTGDKRTKLCFNLNDLKNPQSCYRYLIFAEYDGDDSRENMVDILEEVEIDLKKLLKEGVEINGVKYFFQFYATGDLKFICSLLGCQGGSSKKFCCFCKTEKHIEEGPDRTIEEINQNYQNIKEKLKSSKTKENILRQQNESVCGYPLLPSIPIENICPPALHCCMALCNKLRIFSKSSKFDEFIKDLNIKPIQGRDEYNGNACRKILQKFRKTPDAYDGPNKSLFTTIADIECYAKAEMLKEAEIKLLENLIKELKHQLNDIPSFKIGNKIHAILFHLMPFVIREKSWGIFSEQGIEAIHAKFAEFEKRKISKKFEKSKYAFFEMLRMTFIKEM